MRLHAVLIALASLLLLQGCATVFNGYYDDVELSNAPDSLRVFTGEGVEIPVKKTAVYVKTLVTIDSVADNQQIRYYTSRYLPQTRYLISLRSNLDPVLVLKHGDQSKKVQVFGTIDAGWFIVDAIFGLPMLVDALTGNWNSYDPIDASFK